MDNQLMNIEEYNKLPKGIIREGVISNSPTGCFMTRDEDLPLLRFVVNKRIDGWTVYFGKETQDYIDILSFGDKSNTKEYIRRAFPCTDEVFKLYVR